MKLGGEVAEEQIPEIIWGLVRNAGDYRSSSDYAPSSWNDEIQRGVSLKRQGEFRASVATYAAPMHRDRILNSGLLATMYKAVVCAGYLREAMAVLILLRNVIIEDPVAGIPGLSGVETESSYDYHLPRLLRAAESPATLNDYLLPLSGNSEYRLPRRYEDAIAELQSFNADPINEWARLASRVPDPTAGRSSSSRESKPQGGCYIATAVYGSYDHPSVLVLRRFRDQHLVRTTAGRAFVRMYYRVSPGIAVRMRDTWTLNRIVRVALDAMVSRINRMVTRPDDPA